MFGRTKAWRWLIGAAVAAAVEGVAVLAFTVAVPAPAQAQYIDQVHQFQRRQYQRQQDDGGFFGFFGGGWRHQREPSRRNRSTSEPQHHADYSHAPPPRKQETQPDPNKPVTSIVVMGGNMADWLAYGLEDAFADSPNVEIVRKDKSGSGLLRYQYKSELDWWHVAREELARQKANYVVMMLGVTDRQNIRESDLAKEAEKAAQEQQNANGAAKTDQAGQAKDKEKDKPKPKSAKGVIEFRSDQWAKVYSRRIDETIAALKSRGVPVFWVGLPSIRGTKSTADAVYLNNLFRTRAQRAGVTYIDVWDGFVDDAGKYSSYGPDYEGQTRRLRSGDGVFFTKYGARKLAHYVEREIRRYMSNRVTTLTLPSAPFGPAPGAKSAVRPLAGPVLPLTTTPGNADVLLGGAGHAPDAQRCGRVKRAGQGRRAERAGGPRRRFQMAARQPGLRQAAGAAAGRERTGEDRPRRHRADAHRAARCGDAGAAAAGRRTATSAPPAQAKAPLAAPPPVASAPTSIIAPEPGQATAAEKPAADEAQAKEAESRGAKKQAAEKAQEKAQAEARQRAAERARAEARRSAEERTVRRQTLRPPARVDPRRQQVQRRRRRGGRTTRSANCSASCRAEQAVFPGAVQRECNERCTADPGSRLLSRNEAGPDQQRMTSCCAASGARLR